MTEHEAKAKYITTSQLRERWGNCSQMTIERKIKSDENFPKSYNFLRIRMFDLAEIEAYERTAARERDRKRAASRSPRRSRDEARIYPPRLTDDRHRCAASEIKGPSHVIDGDTVIVGSTHVRLRGVDAADMNTDLGRAAKIIMETIVGDGPLTCFTTGEKTYRRDVGFCFTPDGTDINREIIEQGAALSCPRYDARYLQFEQADALAVQPRATYCMRTRP